MLVILLLALGALWLLGSLVVVCLCVAAKRGDAIQRAAYAPRPMRLRRLRRRECELGAASAGDRAPARRSG